MGPAGSSGENRDHFGPASRSGVLGSGGLAPPLFFPMVWKNKTQCRRRSNLTTTREASSGHPSGNGLAPASLPRNRTWSLARSGPRVQPVTHGFRHCPPDGKRPPHHPVSPRDPFVSTPLLVARG
jgi:hypothetical protein